MALLDSITHFTGKAPAAKNRIDMLLDTLDGTPDGETLAGALRNPNIRPSALTNALRTEYGKDAVTDHSVGDWRRKNIAEVNGL